MMLAKQIAIICDGMGLGYIIYKLLHIGIEVCDVAQASTHLPPMNGGFINTIESAKCTDDWVIRYARVYGDVRDTKT